MLIHTIFVINKNARPKKALHSKFNPLKYNAILVNIISSYSFVSFSKKHTLVTQMKITGYHGTGIVFNKLLLSAHHQEHSLLQLPVQHTLLFFRMITRSALTNVSQFPFFFYLCIIASIFYYLAHGCHSFRVFLEKKIY